MSEELDRLAQQINANCGALFIICIPKTLHNKEHELFYISHPLGKKCDCPQIDERMILEHLGSDMAFHCSSGRVKQYRIVLPRLNYDENALPHEQINTFVLTTLSKDEREELKKKCFSFTVPH